MELPTPKFFAIIPAAGSGVRFGGDRKKQFTLLEGKSLLEWTLEKFIHTGLFSKIVVSLPVSELNLIHIKDIPQNVFFVEGGSSRAESVYKAFLSLQGHYGDVVLVHDAVRPLVDTVLIKRVLNAVSERRPVIPVLPVSDTTKQVENGFVVKTLDRSHLYSVQTPQGFFYDDMRQIYEKNKNLTKETTDEACLFEKEGYKIFTVEGDRKNIKVTTPFDLKLAEIFLKG